MATLKLCTRGAKNLFNTFQHTFILRADDAGNIRVFSDSPDGSQSWGRDFRSDNQNGGESSGRQQGSSWLRGGFSDSWSWGGFRQSNRRGYNQHQNYGSRASHGSGYYYGPGHSSSRWQRAFENLWTFWRGPSWSNMGSWTAVVRANMRYARSHVSPLVLDLDNDGLKLRGHDEGVYFDIDGDRFLERVGWPDASEAQLARTLKRATYCCFCANSQIQMV